MVIFVNGLPLAVIELKNAADENATIWSASTNSKPTRTTSLPVCLQRSPDHFDGTNARIGSLTADKECFMPWKTIAGDTLAERHDHRVGSAAAGRLRETPLPGSHPLFHCLRRRRTRPAGQEDGRLSPVPCGQHGDRANPAGVDGKGRQDRRKAAGITSRIRRGMPNPATIASAWSGTPRVRARA